MSVTITSINVKGLNSPFKWSLLWKEALRHNSDILCAPEMHFSSRKPPACSHKQFPHCFFTNSTQKKAGILVAEHSPFSFQLLHSELDPDGRYLILNASINNCIYAPNTNQKHFYRAVMEKLEPFKQGFLIICGDFNQIADSTLDSSNRSRKCSTALSSLMHSEDTPWRCLHGVERDYTFQAVQKTKIGTITWPRSTCPQRDNLET